jgi:hypothetical protein
MVAGVAAILGASSDEDPPVIGLDRAESDGDVEINLDGLPRPLVSLHIVEGEVLVVKFEEVDAVGETLLARGIQVLGLSGAHIEAGIACLDYELVLGITVELHTLTQSSMTSHYTVAMFSELRSQNRGIATHSYFLLTRGVELSCVNIAIVHDQALSHEVLQCIPINDLKFMVFLQIAHQVIHLLLKVVPLLLVLLH